LVRSAQVPEQSVWPVAQEQVPPWQVMPPVQAWLQVPQLASSESRKAQNWPPLASVHSVWAVDGQPPWHRPPMQTGLSEGQALVQLPQLAALVFVSTQVPEQSVWVPTHLQALLVQVNPLVGSHFTLQSPQLLLSLVGSMQEPLQSFIGSAQTPPHFPLTQD
jgi:hypothetical protein